MVNLLTGGNPKGGLAGTTGSGVPSDENASRFLAQATFGPRRSEINALQAFGDNAYEKWIDEQLGLTPSNLTPYIDFLSDRRQLDFDNFINDGTLTPWNTVTSEFLLSRVGNVDTATSWMRCAMFGPDQLRQRVAFALSEILVVGRRDSGFARGTTDYYDLIINNAFGNYEDLLYQVSLHPMMGWWLSSIGNQKADLSIGRLPDENYAREIMQLFSIGLFELNMDGTSKLDSNGDFIETYDIVDVQEMAKVFTGLWYQDAIWGHLPDDISGQNYLSNDPMDMFDVVHDQDEKTLVGGAILPAHAADPGRNGLTDIRDACRILVQHPSCAPYISKQLIQFLITSNPTPEYVGRITSVFVDDGAGQRGNLGAVVKAILLDPEARRALPDLGNQKVGRLREPTIRTTVFARASDAGNTNMALHDGTGIQYWITGHGEDFLQYPLDPPSVFNFFQPDYARPGEVVENGMVSPVFQILNSFTATTSLNRWWSYAVLGFQGTLNGSSVFFRANYVESLVDVNDTDGLIDEANLLIANGRLRADSRAALRPAIEVYPSSFGDFRRHTAFFLTLSSPEAAILK